MGGESGNIFRDQSPAPITIPVDIRIKVRVLAVPIMGIAREEMRMYRFSQLAEKDNVVLNPPSESPQILRLPRIRFSDHLVDAFEQGDVIVLFQLTPPFCLLTALVGTLWCPKLEDA